VTVAPDHTGSSESGQCRQNGKELPCLIPCSQLDTDKISVLHSGLWVISKYAVRPIVGFSCSMRGKGEGGDHNDIATRLAHAQSCVYSLEVRPFRRSDFDERLGQRLLLVRDSVRHTAETVAALRRSAEKDKPDKRALRTTLWINRVSWSCSWGLQSGKLSLLQHRT
jgi:hypothetical protein